MSAGLYIPPPGDWRSPGPGDWGGYDGGGSMFVSGGQFSAPTHTSPLGFCLIRANFVLVSHSSAIFFWAC